ncbi:MAG: glycosyltransferase family 2 protein [Oscillospiraceae bacterium]|jgi:GT2 family glycosyltransferase
MSEGGKSSTESTRHPGVPEWADHTQVTRLAYKTVRMLKNEGIGKTAFAAKYVISRNLRMRKIRRSFRLTKKERALQEGTKFPYMPLISIAVPLYNTPEKYLRELIESVMAQSYKNWELCLADGSTSPGYDLAGTVKGYIEASGGRIKYRKLDKNGGISENTNRAIEISTGDYIALADHDDIIAEGALFEAAKEINRSGAEFLYTDEALFLNKPSDSESMHLKPDFSPYYLNACNYICHLSVIRRTLLEKTGLYDSRFDGSQDYDMTLRLSENTKKISHIAKPLYWWRIHAGSVADSIDSKPYAYVAAKRAVEEHLRRTGVPADVEYSRAVPMMRVKYHFDETQKVTIIIPTCDHVDLLSRCVESIENKTTYKNYEIMLVENNSREADTFRYYEKLDERYENIRVEKYEGEFNFSAINNFAVSRTDSPILLFMNNDTEVITPDWIQEMAMFVSRPDVAACGPKLLYPDDTVMSGGIAVGVCGSAANICPLYPRDNEGYMSRLAVACDMSALTGACLMADAEAFRKAGGFDENLAVSFNDVDLCLKFRKAGYSIIFNPECEIYHYESKSRGYDSKGEKKKRMEREKQMFRDKWPEYFEVDPGDPFYNRNFGKNSISYDA